MKARVKFIFKLYISGDTPRNQNICDRLKKILAQECPGPYDLKIIDVLDQPQMAEDAKIFVTPALIKQLPLPIRRVVGDLKNEQDVFLHLDIVSKRNTL